MGWSASASNLDPLSHHVTDRRPLSAHHDMSAEPAQSSSASNLVNGRPCPCLCLSTTPAHRLIVASVSEHRSGGSRIHAPTYACHLLRSIIQDPGAKQVREPQTQIKSHLRSKVFFSFIHLHSLGRRRKKGIKRTSELTAGITAVVPLH